MKNNLRLKIIFIIFMLIFVGKVNAYISYKTGEIVRYHGEDYYVIEDSDKNDFALTLLKKEALSYEDTQNYTSDTGASINTNGGMQYGTTNEYETSYIKKALYNWSSKNTREKDLVEDETGYSVRLLSLDELINNFGYTFDVDATSDRYKSSEDTPSWIYEGESYWTMSPYDDSSDKVWYCNSNCSPDSVYYNSILVRPVIKIKKESIDDYDKIIEYNGISFYVMKTSNDSITLLKMQPIVSSEIVDYLSATEIADKVDTNEVYAKMRYYTRDNCLSVGNQDGCNTDYELSDIKQVVDVWVSHNIKEKDLLSDELGYSTRLLSLDELKDLDYKYKAEISSEWYMEGENTPYWIGLFKEYPSIWTMTPYNDSTNQLWTVNSSGVRVSYISDYNYIRPVITLKRSAIDNDSNDDTKDDKSTSDDVKVPNTLEQKSLIIIIIGFIMVLVGVITFYSVSKVIKERK